MGRRHVAPREGDVDDQRIDVRLGEVDAGGQAGRAAAEDEDLDLGLLGLDSGMHLRGLSDREHGVEILHDGAARDGSGELFADLACRP